MLKRTRFLLGGICLLLSVLLVLAIKTNRKPSGYTNHFVSLGQKAALTKKEQLEIISVKQQHDPPAYLNKADQQRLTEFYRQGDYLLVQTRGDYTNSPVAFVLNLSQRYLLEPILPGTQHTKDGDRLLFFITKSQLAAADTMSLSIAAPKLAGQRRNIFWLTKAAR